MISRTEAELLALAVHTIRQDWPTASLLTLIRRDLSNWALRDLGCALMHIALDQHPDGSWVSVTPARVKEQGPWLTDNGEAAAARTRAEQERQQRLDEIATRNQEQANCPHCDDRGYQTNGWRCPHDGLTPDQRAERSRTRSAAARAAITRPLDDQEQT